MRARGEQRARECPCKSRSGGVQVHAGAVCGSKEDKGAQ